jgi:hypothetical protein
MQIGPEQGQFQRCSSSSQRASLHRVRHIYGYSALAVAFTLPLTGKLIACDIVTSDPDCDPFGVKPELSRGSICPQPAIKTLDDLLVQDGRDTSTSYLLMPIKKIK